MKTLHLFLLLLAITTLACCKKDKYETTITGHVYTHGTTDFPGEQPLKILLIEESGGSGLSTGERVKATTYTDMNGYYKFEFESDNSRHWVQVDDDYTPPLHFPANTSDRESVHIGSTQTLNLFMGPFAWLELHVKNTQPQVGDEIWINFGNGEDYRLLGPVDYKILTRKYGNTELRIPYRVYRNDTSTLFYHLVNLTGFDTTYSLLNY